MMLNGFAVNAKKSIPIIVLTPNEYSTWLSQTPIMTRNWLQQTSFKNETGCVALIPDQEGMIKEVVVISHKERCLWDVGHLPYVLPENCYEFRNAENHLALYTLGWGLGSYQFTRYRKPKKLPAQLNSQQLSTEIKEQLEALFLVRDLINTPTDDLGPAEFSARTKILAQSLNIHFQEIVGEELLQQNYQAIYTVGRASDDPPRLIDLRFGESHHPKVTLIGKGVCFDSGGLDIKPAAYMALMKKDMGGAAHVLGLMQMIVAAKLPIQLRVLIPLAENAISGNAYRPGDIIKSRKGLTIEVGNTDAEGRLLLADALTEAASENPALIIDIATLTGAARVALGTELPVVFSNHDETVNALIKQGEVVHDPMWRLPLYNDYREHLNSNIADINNNSQDGYGGAISAALFLKEFVSEQIPWVHFDLMAWNTKTRPGRPQGGEAMALRAIFAYLTAQFNGKK